MIKHMSKFLGGCLPPPPVLRVFWPAVAHDLGVAVVQNCWEFSKLRKGKAKMVDSCFWE